MSALHAAVRGARAGRGGFRCYGASPGAGGVWAPEPGYDLRSLARFCAPGELLAFWELWNPSVLNYSDGPGEQLLNPGFEVGDPPASWTAVVATASRQAGNMGSPVESFVGRVSINLVTSGYIYQTALVVGARYRLVIYCRGDGVSGYPVIREGGNLLWTGTTSNATQLAEVEFTATATTMRLYVQGPGTGLHYAEFDNGSLVELPGIVTVPNKLSPGTYDLDFTLGAQQAWLHPSAWLGQYPCAEFDGVGHYGESNVLAGQFTGDDIPFAPAWTLKLASTGQNAVPIALGNSTDNVPINEVYEIVGPNWRSFKRDNLGGSVGHNTVEVSTTDPHAMSLQHKGQAVTIWRDAAPLSVVDAASNVAAATFDRLTVGAQGRIAVSNHLAGLVREFAVVRAMSDTQAAALARRLMSRSYL